MPLLVVHSHSWSSAHSLFSGRPHFDVVRDRVEQVKARGWAAWFVTSSAYLLFFTFRFHTSSSMPLIPALHGSAPHGLVAHL